MQRALALESTLGRLDVFNFMYKFFSDAQSLTHSESNQFNATVKVLQCHVFISRDPVLLGSAYRLFAIYDSMLH